MALIWRKVIKEDTYEVRSAGNTVRLYSNGIFHSHYNPNHVLTKSIWDLLLLPALYLPYNQAKRVLVLGVGGGTVIKMLQRYLVPSQVIGIEINPVHITVARKYFHVTKNEATLIQADGVKWIKDYSGSKFDLIIDDMFGHVGGEFSRPVELNKDWFRLLHSHVSNSGLLVVNTTEKNVLKSCSNILDSKNNPLFPCVYQFEDPRCDNFVGAFFKKPHFKQELLDNIKKLPSKKIRNAFLNMEYKRKKLR